MLPTRMTLSGRDTSSVNAVTSSSISLLSPGGTGCPSGPMTSGLTFWLPASSPGEVMASVSPMGFTAKQDLADVLARLDRFVRGGGIGHGYDAVDDGPHLTTCDCGPHVFAYGGDDRCLLRTRPGPQRRGVHRSPLGHQHADVELPARPALHADDHHAAVRCERIDVATQ